MAKFCANCGKELKENSDVCLECGVSAKKENSNEKKKKKMPTWLIVVLVIFGLIIVAGVLNDDDNINEASQTNSEDNIINENNDNTDTEIPKAEPKTTEKRKGVFLEEGHYGYSDDYGFAYYIEGYIKNDSDYSYSYIQVSFNTYDSEGNTLGSCLANNSGLEANGRWKFKAICSGDAKSVSNYKFDKITKW